jgi:radical SAM protein with 4Fe4S-binding SPASM domain
MTPDEGALYYAGPEWGRAKHCQRPWDGLIVKTNGDVVFCPDHWATEFRLGNIRRESLKEIWTGPRAVRFRESIDRDGLFEVCQRCCVANGEMKVTG